MNLSNTSSSNTPSTSQTSCGEDYRSDPIEVTENDAFLAFMTNNNRVFGLDSNVLPILKIPKETTELLGIQRSEGGVPKRKITNITNEITTENVVVPIHGIKAPISIVKVRKIAYDTLVRSLYKKSTQLTTQLDPKNARPGIYTTLNNRIVVLYNKDVNAEFDLCEYGKVFDNANEDETEDSDDTNGGIHVITRKSLNDNNTQLADLDFEIFKIVSMLMYMKNSNISNDLKYNINEILTDFIVTSSVKEYLDIGQLYAICEPTILNNNNSYTLENIQERINNTDFDYEHHKPPRKPMLESIDGAATRIAANNYFTSYCNCVLKTKNKSKSATFYIDNNDVFLLGMLVSDDISILNFINNYFGTNSLDEVIIGFKNLYDQIKKEKNNKKMIDLYCLVLLKYDKQLNDLYNNNKSRIQNNKNVILINDEFYFCASVASFICKYNKDNSIIKGLISCNFDSLCHDNGESKVYRLVMILMFILKNNTDSIIKELQDMFPFVFIKNTSNFKDQHLNIVNDTKIHKQYIFKNDEDNTSKYKQYIDWLLTSLDPIQQNIFKILASYNDHEIENGLYRRLYKKSCYVFPILHSNYVGIASNRISADVAFDPVELSLENEINRNRNRNKNIFPINALDQGVIIPHYVNCAIDAPLKHGLSLSNYDLTGQESDVWVTAVTRVDAASQDMSKSYHYTQPISIKIPLLKNENEEQRNEVIYQYIYGNTPYTFNKNEIYECQLDENYCNLYRELVTEFENTNFYFRKRDIHDFKQLIDRPLDNLLQAIIDIDDNIVSKEITRKISREFSVLKTNAICGKKKKVGVANPSGCQDYTVSSDQLNDAKTNFLIFLKDSMTNDDISVNGKKLIVLVLDYFLTLTREDDINNLDILIDSFSDNNITKLFDELNPNLQQTDTNADEEMKTDTDEQPNIPQPEPEPEPNNNNEEISPLPRKRSLSTSDETDNADMDVDNKDTSNTNKKRITTVGFEENWGGRSAEGILNNNYNLFTKQQDNVNVAKGNINPLSDIANVIKPKPKTESKTESNTESNTESKTESNTEPKTEPSNDMFVHDLQLSYTTMFGKYGFDMSINKDGEYELIILDTEEQYKAYLKKYQLEEEPNQESLIHNNEVDMNMNDNNNNNNNSNKRKSEGGKKQTKKQVKKPKTKKQTNKRIQKYKNNKSKTRKWKSIKQPKNTRRNPRGQKVR
jgi:hypothetical protein